jgi:hypothetical protein
MTPVIAKDTDCLTCITPTSSDAKYSLQLTNRGGERFLRSYYWCGLRPRGRRRGGRWRMVVMIFANQGDPIRLQVTPTADRVLHFDADVVL